MTNLVALIAEDEPMVRAVAAEALADAGFRVIEAADADQALTIFEAQGDEIDVLWTDVKLPGVLDGIDLAQHVRDHWPWVRLLLTSGYPDAAALSHETRFLPKPYDVTCMPLLLREMIVAADDNRGTGAGQPRPFRLEKSAVASISRSGWH